MKISKIKINGMTNPVGYAFDSVRAAWLVTETEAKKADHVRIEAAEDPGFENIICTKEGSALDSAGEELEIRLKCRTRYYVRVSVRGDNGEEAVSEECAYFETAKREEPWLGSWIKPQPGDRFHPIFEKTFSARGDVTDARLYISGVGMYTAALNGEKVGNETLTPYFSDYHTEVQYQTYDVTDQIREDNTLCVELGNGWYKGAFGLSYTSGIYGSEYQMIAELHLKYADGSEDVAQQNMLRQKAENDALTGLLNRAAFEQMKIRLCEISQPFALLLIDIDVFKSINDTYGHEMGDKALIRAANLLKESFRSTDHVFRIGGDEFTSGD